MTNTDEIMYSLEYFVERVLGCPEDVLMKEDWINGKLAVSLEKTDTVIARCKEKPAKGQKECLQNFLNHSTMEYLNGISVGKCLALKAYHIWNAKNRPYQTDETQRVYDHRDAIKDIFQIKTCVRDMPDDVKQQIRAYYGKRIKNTYVDDRAFWKYLGNPTCENDDYHAAEQYLEEFSDFLHSSNGGTFSKINLDEYVDTNKSMMSILEFLYFTCHKSAFAPQP